MRGRRAGTSLLLRSRSPALKAPAPTSDPCPPLTPLGPLRGRPGAKGSSEGLPAHSDPGWSLTAWLWGWGLGPAPVGGVCSGRGVAETGVRGTRGLPLDPGRQLQVSPACRGDAQPDAPELTTRTARPHLPRPQLAPDRPAAHSPEPQTRGCQPARPAVGGGQTWSTCSEAVTCSADLAMHRLHGRRKPP